MKTVSVLPMIKAVPSTTLPIMEVTHVVEGEGMRIGVPRILVRVGGCAVGCINCDTTKSWTLKQSRLFTIENLEHLIDETAQGLVNEISITGGEPLHYIPQVTDLAQRLQRKGYEVSLETSGKVVTGWSVHDFNWVSLDLKTPSSTVHANVDEREFLLDALHYAHCQVKAIVSDAFDLKWLSTVCYQFLTQDNPLILTPAAGQGATAEKLRDITQMILDWNKAYNIRIISQQHVLLNMP